MNEEELKQSLTSEQFTAYIFSRADAELNGWKEGFEEAKNIYNRYKRPTPKFTAVEIDPPKNKNLRWNEKNLSALKSLLADGLTHRQIAKKFGVRTSPIKWAVKKYL